MEYWFSVCFWGEEVVGIWEKMNIIMYMIRLIMGK
jgi:hypothetical protein